MPVPSHTPAFPDIDAARRQLRSADYVATTEISTVVFLAEALGKPVLAEGPAGVGKTELAKAWATASGRPLIRLQCYEGLDESKALYEWEYAKQMLYTQLLRDGLKDVVANASSLRDAAERLAAEEDVFFSEHFLLPRPLLQALVSDEPVVLLIDEIDRADVEFEAFLLEILSDFQASIPEIGTVRAKHQPMVVLTSNNTRELSEALKRRCLYLFVDYPSLDGELEVVRLRVPGLDRDLARQAVSFVQGLRDVDLRKAPSIAETLDWARALLSLNAERIDRNTLDQTLNVLLKYEADLQTARRLMGPLTRGIDGPRDGGGRDADGTSSTRRPGEPDRPDSGRPDGGRPGDGRPANGGGRSSNPGRKGRGGRDDRGQGRSGGAGSAGDDDIDWRSGVDGGWGGGRPGRN